MSATDSREVMQDITYLCARSTKLAVQLGIRVLKARITIVLRAQTNVADEFGMQGNVVWLANYGLLIAHYSLLI